MEKIKKFSKKYILLLLLLLILPSTAALSVLGYYGASDDLHIGWLYEMDQVVKMGQFPPRFVPDLSFGFGYPLFNFVYPLPFYIGEIFHLMGMSLVDSVKLVFAFSLIGSGFAMYFFLRKFAGQLTSLLGATLYVYTPYRSTDVYIRGDVGEALAFIFLPLVALFVTVICSEKFKHWRPIGLGALSIACLVLSHNIVVYMFLPFIFLLGTAQTIFLSTNKLTTFLKLVATFCLGLLVTVYFWLPAIIDSSLMKYDTVFNFVDHFPTIAQLITPFWGYGASVAGPGDGMSFFIGFVNLVAIFLGSVLLIFLRKKYSLNQKVIMVWAFITFIISIFVMNYRSSFIWQTVPLLPYFQFPWRFLIITTFISPIFLIALEKNKFSIPISVFTLLLVLVLNVSIFHPHDFLGRTDSYYIDRYIPVPEASKEYRNLQEEYLRLPKSSLERPTRNFETIIDQPSEVKKLTKNNPLSIDLHIETQKPLTLNYSKYLFPGWFGELDGKPIELTSGIPYGQIVVDVPTGSHSLKIYFAETPLKRLFDVISLLSLIGALVLIRPWPKRS